MSISKMFFLPLLACSLFLLTGALRRQPTNVVSQKPFDFVPQPIDEFPLADKVRSSEDLLEEAVARYHPSRTPWLSMAIWQQWDDGESAYQITGRFHQAPDQRARLEVEVNAGGAESKLCLISDGVRLWEVRRLAADKPETKVVPLSSKASLDPARTLEINGCAGFVPLLKLLQGRLQERHMVTGTWKGKPAVVIRGPVIPDEEALNDLPGDVRPALHPREAAVYLDAETLWPHRIEWWGSAHSAAPLHLLLQLEFRDPVIDNPLPDSVCAQLFTTGI